MAETKSAALQKLFVKLFTAEDLRQFLAAHASRDVQHALPSQASLATYAFEAVGALERRGEINAEFFAAFHATFPMRKSDIDEVARLWLDRDPGPAPAAPSEPPPRFRWLSDGVLQSVYRAAIATGLAPHLSTLVGGLSPEYVGTLLQTASPPNIQLLHLLQRMNEVRGLRDGTIPLVAVLANAELLTIGQDQETLFRTTRERIERGEHA